MAKSIHPEMASLVLAIGACVVVSLLIVFCLLTVVTIIGRGGPRL